MRTYVETGSSVEEAKEKILRSLDLKDYEVYDVKVLEAPARGFLGIISSGVAKIEMTIREDKAKKAAFLLKELLDKLGYGSLVIESKVHGQTVADEPSEGEPAQAPEPAVASEAATTEPGPAPEPGPEVQPDTESEPEARLEVEAAPEEAPAQTPEAPPPQRQSPRRDLDARVELQIRGKDLGGLIGRRGKRVKALEHLINLFTNIDRKNYLKVQVDVEDYNQERRRRLQSLAERAARTAMERGRPLKLKPMDVYDRKIIHEHLAEHGGVTTASEGKEPERCLVVTPTRRAPPRSGQRDHGRGGYRGHGHGQREYGGGGGGAQGQREYGGGGGQGQREYGGGQGQDRPRGPRGHGYGPPRHGDRQERGDRADRGERSDRGPAQYGHDRNRGPRQPGQRGPGRGGGPMEQDRGQRHVTLPPPPPSRDQAPRSGLGWGNPPPYEGRQGYGPPSARGYEDDRSRSSDRPPRDRRPRRGGGGGRRPSQPRQAPDWDTQQPPRPPRRDDH